MKSRSFLCSGAVAVALAGLATAQNVATFPSDHATIPNGSTSISWFPYSSGVSRQMIVYEAWDLPGLAGRTISRIGFRQDGNRASTARAIQVEVRMAHTDRTAANLLNNFANNYTLGAPTTVFGPALYNLPALTTMTTGQQIWLDLTTPFLFNGTDNLLVEFRVTANNNGNQQFTYYLDVGDTESPNRQGVPGCPHSGNQTATLDTRSVGVGANWLLDLRNAPANTLTFLLMAPAQQMPAAFSLQPFLPGVSSQCMGQIPVIGAGVLTTTTNSGGSYTWTIAIPNDRLRYNDSFITTQAAMLDLFSPGGIVVSNADEVQIGIAPAASILSSSGNATATTGAVYRNQGVVTLFDHN